MKRISHSVAISSIAAAGISLSLALGVKPATAQTYTLTTLATFNSGNGANSESNLVLDGSGNLYGTTLSGGSSNYGTVFKIAAGTNTITTLVSFNPATNGADPVGGLTIDGSGNLYGTDSGAGSSQGGPDPQGTVFKIAAGTSTLSTIATFNITNGSGPLGAPILDSSGNIYGTTYGGGSSSVGTVFKIASGTSTITTLATLTGAANGSYPYAGLTLDSSGNLYGTTTKGGANGDGTVFKIAAGTNTFTTLATFTGTANGQNPYGNIAVDSSGNLYGTTEGGGANSDGTVFKIAAGTNMLTTLATFDYTNGEYPHAGLTLDGSGNLYGTTNGGGANGDGTVFKIAAGTNTLATLATFTGTANGADPYANLTIDGSGNIYGTTYNGGSNNDGTVFKLTPVGSSAAPEPAALALLLPALTPLAAVGVRRRSIRR